MRSVSHPLFASSEYKEGDPLRALTSSISFGRFMTEPLDWEKWSSFSHNRTLEDVQKHSRPGAVAEKKAFFEAHYKKIASKKATKSPQKENKSPNHSPQTNNTTNFSPPRSDTHSAINETQENESSTPVTYSVLSPINEPIMPSKHVCSPSTTTLIDLDLSKVGNVGDTNQKEALTEDVCSPSTNLVLAQCENFDDDMASSVQVEHEKESTENVSLEKHRLYQSDKNKKTRMKDAISRQTKVEILSSKSVSKNGVCKPQSLQKAQTPRINHMKVTRDVTDKKRSALKSLHMSMNFLPAGNKNGILKTISKPLKDRPIQQPLNLKVKKNSQVLPPQENRSNLNASSVCTKKPRSSSSTVPSSFSFRSEERAAKRKEFFQKLEEKGNTKEMEKIHLQPKLKARNDNKRLQQNTTSDTKSLSSMHKVPPTQPCSPKLGRKPILRLIQESSSKPKNFIEINKKKLSASMASLLIKKMSKK